MNERFKPHKKFEVEQPKKKFMPHSDKKFDINKKKFDVEEEGQQQEQTSNRFKIEAEFGADMADDRVAIGDIDFEGSPISWARQRDANSCGVCMLHNLANFMNFGYEGDGNILEPINEVRQLDGLDSLVEGERLTTKDLRDYFLEKDYKINTYVDDLDRELMNNHIRSENFNFIYTTTGDHFTGVVKKENRFFLLDSLTKSPIEVNVDAIITGMNNAIDHECNVSVVNEGIINNQDRLERLNSNKARDIHDIKQVRRNIFGK